MNYIDIDRSDILANINIDKIEEDFFSSRRDYDDDDDEHRINTYSNPENDIEAIFERPWNGKLVTNWI